MRKVLFLLVVVYGILSCSKSNAEPQLINGISRGEFIEITPVSNRTTLLFSATSNQLKETRALDAGNSSSKTFSIQLLDNGRIEFSSNEADEEAPRDFHYQIIDVNTFEIGNINPNDSENAIMIFKRT